MVTDFGQIILAIYEDKDEKHIGLLTTFNFEEYLSLIMDLSNSNSPWIMYNLVIGALK